MSVKTALKIKLFAGDTLVAESDDSGLWQRVLATISTGANLKDNKENKEELIGRVESLTPLREDEVDDKDYSAEIKKFANEIGVTPAELVGACGPKAAAPFIHLDHHCWEALKRNTPGRGPGAISPIVLSATLLAMWFRHAKLGMAKQSEAIEVLDSINVQDKNPARGLKNCEWLQPRTDGIVLNPSRISTAVRVCRAYCTQKPLPE